MPCHKRAPPGSSSFTASKTQQKAETGLWLLNLLLCSGLPLSVYNELCPGAPGHQGCVGAGADGSRQPTEHPAGRGSPPGRVPCAGRRCHHPACRAAGSRVGSCCCLTAQPQQPDPKGQGRPITLSKPAARGHGDCGPAPQSLVCKFGVRLSRAGEAACNYGEERQKDLRSPVSPAPSLPVPEPPAKPSQALRPCLGCCSPGSVAQACQAAVLEQ